MAINTIDDFKDAVVTVMGLGRFKQGSGVGATKWLMRHGAQTIITDLKNEEDLQESIAEVMRWYEKCRQDFPDREIYHPLFVLGEHREEDFTDVQAVMQNPDVPREDRFVALARQNNVPIFSDVSLFFRFCPQAITAVTGTRGKTTTTTLIGEIYKAHDPRAVMAGNIKVSPLESLDEILADASPRPIVLELSSTLIDSLDVGAGFPGPSKHSPEIVVMTNVFPDHLNRYKSFDDYKHSKEQLLTMQSAEQVAILNADVPDVVAMASRALAKIYWFTKGTDLKNAGGTLVQDGAIVFRQSGKDEVIIKLDEIALEGEHNLENILAAVCATKLAGVSTDKIVGVLKTFKGVPDRQEVLREVNGVTYVNDTTATSPDGAMAALKRFGQKGKIVLLAGGASKNLPFEAFGKMIQATCKYVVLFEGTATDDLAQAIGTSLPSTRVKSMKEAMQAASSVAQKGEIVLLSPGTASFGIFKNEFDRGDQFKAEVAKL
ncbi:MAG: UDP-N-acetylmuramoyl-L-alanine--D-glutamate ligase [Patescibacteria group bacterium]